MSRSQEERLELTPLSENGVQLTVFPITFTFDEATPGTPLRMSIQRPGEEKPDVFDRVTELAKAQRPESTAKRYPTLRTADYCARLSFPVSPSYVQRASTESWVRFLNAGRTTRY